MNIQDHGPAPAAAGGDGDGIDVVTFGCRLNAYESEVIRNEAVAAGIDNTVVINTCAVTNEAERQARQAIRRARRERPHARIIVTGCAAQITPDAYAAMPEVDAVLGNEEKLQRTSYQDLGANVAAEERIKVDDIMSVKETAGHLIEGFGGRARAFVQIQNGCDHRCTFCIIPYGRGNSRSVPMGEVVRQIRTLVDQGIPEIVLSGVDITSYGADLPGNPPLGRLVERILHHVPDLQRLRLSSIDAVEVDAALFRVIVEDERLMPHLHLSLQAGDDMILKRMKRRHSRDDAVAFCNRLREHRPDLVFGADLIAGFPTETEQMFRNTLALVEDCGLTYLHVFPYSARPGTPAARMPQLSGDIIRERAARLRDAGAAALTRYLTSCIGQTVPVLMETDVRGRTDHFASVMFARPQPAGRLVTARLTAANGNELIAEAA